MSARDSGFFRFSGAGGVQGGDKTGHGSAGEVLSAAE
jgi:hypothetical protein